MNAYFLVCSQDHEIVSPATHMVGRNMLTGESIDLGVNVPEYRVAYKRGQKATERTIARARAMVSTGNWTWEDCGVNRAAGRAPIFAE